MTEMAARLPAAASTVTSCGGASRLTRRTVYIARPAPTVMRGASGPRTSPKPMLAHPASTTPGDDARLGAAHLQAAGRHVPSRSRQADDRERHRQAGDTEHEQVPPRRNGVPPEVIRQIREQPLLGVVHELEERPRDERDDNPDDGREHQDRDEALAPQDRQGIGRRSGRCGRVGHRAISYLVIRRPYSACNRPAGGSRPRPLCEIAAAVSLRGAPRWRARRGARVGRLCAPGHAGGPSLRRRRRGA